MNKNNITVALFVAVAIVAFCSQTVSARSEVARKAAKVCANADSPLNRKLQCVASGATFQSAVNRSSSKAQKKAADYMKNARNSQDVADAITRAVGVRRVQESDVSRLSNKVYNAVVGR